MQPFINDPEIAEFAQASAATCASAGGSPAGIAARLAGDGLLGVIAAEAAGGLALPLKFAQPVLWAAGQARLAFPLAETLAALPLLDAALPDVATQVTSGAAILSATAASTLVLAQGAVTGKAGMVPLGSDTRWLVAPVGPALAVIDLAVAEAGVLPGEALDPYLPRPTLVLRDHPVAAVVEDPDLVSDWRARDLAFRAVDAAAGAAATIDLAIGFLTPRVQFGKKLVSFQSLRHDLARAKMQLESLNRLTEVALLAPTPMERLSAAEIAYAQAAATAPATAEMALHMHGGMGFTWDIPVHLYMRRMRDSFSTRGATWARSAVAARVLEAVL